MSKLKAVINGKCPQCRKGDMFEYSAYNITKFHKMHEYCPVCGLRFVREPGFFIGAMYVNYAFSVAIIVAVGIALNVLNYYNLYSFIFSVVGLTILLLPVLFRFSRILYLHLFGGVDYNPNKANPLE